MNKSLTLIEEPGPPGRTYTSITGYFHDKTKISKENFRVDYYLPQNVARDKALYFLLPGLNHLQLKFNSKMQDVIRGLDLNRK